MTPVLLENGVYTPVDMIRPGDRVVGAFGEINTVIAIEYYDNSGINVNNVNGVVCGTDTMTFIGVDKGFYTLNAEDLLNYTYGKEHPVLVGAGEPSTMTYYGVDASRLKPLTIGTVIQNPRGDAQTVNDFFIRPAEYSVKYYGLVVDGSHTIVASNFAMAAWPREDDFDYDTWTPRA